MGRSVPLDVAIPFVVLGMFIVNDVRLWDRAIRTPSQRRLYIITALLMLVPVVVILLYLIVPV
jgi:hypothetical protein